MEGSPPNDLSKDLYLRCPGTMASVVQHTLRRVRLSRSVGEHGPCMPLGLSATHAVSPHHTARTPQVHHVYSSPWELIPVYINSPDHRLLMIPWSRLLPLTTPGSEPITAPLVLQPRHPSPTNRPRTSHVPADTGLGEPVLATSLSLPVLLQSLRAAYQVGFRLPRVMLGTISLPFHEVLLSCTLP